jgi:cholesterol transport system auxiliary component
MTARRLAPAALLMLAGCISLGPKPPASLIRLDPVERAPADAGQPLTAARSVTVLPPTASQEIAVARVPVRSGAAQLAYLKDATYADQPTRLFGSLLSETIRARTGRPVLDVRGYSLAPGLRLATRILAFGADADRREVAMVVDASLQPAGGATPTLRRFEARTPAATIDAATVAPALDKVANEVAAQIADWVGR